jgi:hypothetical protein
VTDRYSSRRFLAISLGSAAAFFCMSGCTETTTASVGELPEKNIAEWVMPLDSYVAVVRFESYAQNLLVQTCMESAGYPYDVPYRDLTSDNGPTMNSVDRQLFNVAVAAKFGYHDAPANDSTADIWQAFGDEVAAEANANPAADSKFHSCLKAADRELRAPDGWEQLAGQLAGAAYDGALESKPVKAKARAWRDCMMPLGIPDLPRSPTLMPSESQAKKFGLENGGSETTSAAVEEIREATFDAQCQQSTGYLRSLYNGEWKRQVPLLRENADELERVKAQTRAYEKRVMKVISQHAPNR